MKFAIVMTGGVCKGAFQAGSLKAFAEAGLKPSVIVGTSAGAINAGFLTSLLTSGNFTPSKIDENLINPWIHEMTFSNLWGKAELNKKDSVRNILSDINANPFLLIKRLANLQTDVWMRLRQLLSMSFVSVFNREVLVQYLNRNLKTPSEIKEDAICAVSLTDLFGHSETINNKLLNNYSDFFIFNFKKGESNLEEKFKFFRNAISGSSCFPGMFQPTEMDIKGNGQKRLYVDGGITKNAPFGRAIKLDPEIEYIFLISTSPITKPVINEIKDFPSVSGQVYEIIITKDIVNDYRKVTQINQKINLLKKIIERDEEGNILDNEKNHDLCKLAGFKSVKDFLSKRCVEVIFIEPDHPLEGDPFAGFYKKERRYLMESYIKHGYEIGKKVIKDFTTTLNK
ncbi:MAG: patatin-like phospholipase family protein [Candidatus Sericytochromatia bacterium]